MIVVIAHVKAALARPRRLRKLPCSGRSLIQSERCGLWMLTSNSHRLTRSASEVN